MPPPGTFVEIYGVQMGQSDKNNKFVFEGRDIETSYQSPIHVVLPCIVEDAVSMVHRKSTPPCNQILIEGDPCPNNAVVMHRQSVSTILVSNTIRCLNPEVLRESFLRIHKIFHDGFPERCITECGSGRTAGPFH